MAAALDHRGPDGDGSFDDDGVALGFRRLAIIDLSDAGMQPFASDDGALQLLHNGEIYNYRELRRELEARGHSLPHARPTPRSCSARTRSGATTASSRFNGMWAFALWDGRQAAALLLARPLRREAVLLLVGRRALRVRERAEGVPRDPRCALEPNLRAVRDYLEQGYVDHTDETFFAGIRKLPPAHSLVVDDGGLRIERYWSLEPRDAPADPAEAVRELFLDAVRLRLRSDVPVGTCLSGGIDSSAIAVHDRPPAAHRGRERRPVGDRQRTFTAYFEEPGFDERPYRGGRRRADALAAALGLVRRRPSSSSALPSIVATQDEPFGVDVRSSRSGSSCARRRAAGLKVMLDGQGADEMLAGYHGYFGPFFADLLTARSVARARRRAARVPVAPRRGRGHDGGRARAAVRARSACAGPPAAACEAAPRSFTPTLRAERDAEHVNGFGGRLPAPPACT